jgi:hypothetical protein
MCHVLDSSAHECDMLVSTAHCDMLVSTAHCDMLVSSAHSCDMLAVTLEGTQLNHVTKHAITQTKPTAIRLSKRTVTLVLAPTK